MAVQIQVMTQSVLVPRQVALVLVMDGSTYGTSAGTRLERAPGAHAGAAAWASGLTAVLGLTATGRKVLGSWKI